MNLDELRSVQDRERQKDSLQHLRDSFYEEVGRYIADLKAEREREADRADDPFASPEVRRLTDEIETAEEVAESIYERRMGKVVKNASLAAAGYATDTEGLTAEEETLFEDLVERIQGNKETVLDVLAGTPTAEATGDVEAESSSDPRDRPTGAQPNRSATGIEGDPGSTSARSADVGSTVSRDATGDGEADGADRPPSEATAVADPGDDSPTPEESDDGVSAASVMGGSGPAEGSDESPTDGEAPDRDPEAAQRDDPEDRATLRITDEVGEIFGVDGTSYDLSPDDVVALPEENAEPLIEKDAARRID